jgi:phage shock protein A
MPASPSDELDLRGLDLRHARDYVLAYARTLKEAEQRARKLVDEARLWSDREVLARSRGREDLAAAALTRGEAVKARVTEADAEVARLRGQVAVLKERLKLKLHGEIERSVDSEQLEAELEMLTGDKKETPPTAAPGSSEPAKGTGGVEPGRNAAT